MAVLIGSARIDENGKAHGGKAGDQTGREVSTQSWYLHSKGWRVFRAKRPEQAEKIALCMENACKNDKIGYDQYQRLTLYNLAKDVGFDVSKVAAACETDCSALVRVCCAFAGIALGNFTTSGEAGVLLGSGAFVELTGSKYTDRSDYLGRGDILVTKSQGHTVVVLSNGAKRETAVQKDGSLGAEILRRGDVGEAVRTMQENLIALGYDVGRYGADGDFGSDTEGALKAYQEAHGLAADGEYGPLTHASMLAALEAQAGAATPVEPEGNLTVAKGSWNLRTGPGTDYPIAAVVHGGDRLAEVEADGWLPVLCNGEVRWISGKAVS